LGLGQLATAQAAIVYSGPVHIDIPAGGVSLDVVTGASGASVANPSITATGSSFLAMQDNGTIPPGNSGASGNGAYVGIHSTVFNLYEGHVVQEATGDLEETYCDGAVTAQIDATQTWNFNSSENLIGFRFVDENDGQLHYGWLRISLGADATSSSPRAIVEYAYDDTANAWVYAGVKTTATWDFDPATGLPAFVQPMQHALNGALPILTQDTPVPNTDEKVAALPAGALQQEIATLWARGIVPNVYTGPGADNGALSTAQILQAAGEPIHIFSQLTTQDFWPPTATPNPWFTGSDGVTSYPVYPLATPTGAYNALVVDYQYLKSNGINSVNGLWMDYETYPGSGDFTQQHLAYPSQFYTDSYAAPSGVLVSPYGPSLLTDGVDDVNNPMSRYSWDLEYILLKNSAYKALTDTFGTGPIFGDFLIYFSSTAVPYVPIYQGPRPYTTYAPEAGIVANPPIYADTSYLAGDFLNANPSNYPLNQTNADNVFWFRMLTAASTCTANNGAAGRTVAFMTYYVTEQLLEPYGDYAMSASVYKELLRHLWLRGVSGMRIFNPGPPFEGPLKSYTELEYARSVLDEMLSFRTFLANGVPMNYSVNSPEFTGGIEWSGLSNSATNPTQWVVRTVSRSGSPGTVASITTQTGLTFRNIPAPTNGATYILNSDGTRHRVDSRPSSLDLQFENGYQDSSGNNLTAAPGRSPSSFPYPSTSTSVPTTGSNVTSVLNGAYGLYANQNNQHSISLSETSSGHANAGNYVQVANAGNVFNADSFTVEAFADVDASSPDNATMLAKGPISASNGAYDWEMQHRSGGQIELRIGLANSSTYFLRSSSALTSGWHHVAFTYDTSTGTSSPTITLYVDHVKWAWGQSSNRVLTGVLPQAMMRNTADDFVVGYFGRGIIATFDEVRFTPEVLDPLQMLTNAALQ